MFLVEKLIGDYHAKIEAWETARDKWVNQDSYGYRSRREYESNHPRPGKLILTILKGLALAIAIALFAGIIITVIVSDNSDSNHTKKTSTSQKKTVAQTGVKVGDKVQVVFGDYKDSVGVVVSVDGDSAVIKLTNSTLTHEDCTKAANCGNGYGTDNGQLLTVNSFNNLVQYVDVK